MSVIGGPAAPGVCERGSEGSGFQTLILQDCEHTHALCTAAAVLCLLLLFLSVSSVASSWSRDTAHKHTQTIDGRIAVPRRALPRGLDAGAKAVYGSTETEATNCDPVCVEKSQYRLLAKEHNHQSTSTGGC